MDIKTTLSETLEETESDSKDIKIAQDHFINNNNPPEISQEQANKEF